MNLHKCINKYGNQNENENVYCLLFLSMFETNIHMISSDVWYNSKHYTLYQCCIWLSLPILIRTFFVNFSFIVLFCVTKFARIWSTFKYHRLFLTIHNKLQLFRMESLSERGGAEVDDLWWMMTKHENVSILKYIQICM